MPRRYLFLCPDRQTASGGIAVIYDTVAHLRRLGHDAAILHSRSRAGYPDHPDTPPKLHDPGWLRHEAVNMPRRKALQHRLWIALDRINPGPLPRARITPEDFLVVPDFMLKSALEAYPGNEIGVFVQNTFALQRQIGRIRQSHADPLTRIRWAIGVSEICMEQISLLDLDHAYLLPASMRPQAFPFVAQKEPLITYMPRKRREEASYLHHMLERRGRIAGYRIEAIDALPRAQVAQMLGRSRFFLSLQKHESIGFPAAEAMASGAIAIGYTGVGGREYFTPETGIPVPEDDSTALILAVEAAVAEYARDPARLNALRRHAAEVVNARYSTQAFETTLAQIWPQIDAL